MFHMKLGDFYQAFEVAHKKYPMHVTQDSHIRYQSGDCEYCPITAVAYDLVDRNSPVVYGQVLPEDFVPEIAKDWAPKIGLSDEDAQYIIMASDYENPADIYSHWEDVYEVYAYWLDVGKVKEIRKKLLAICKENAP